VEQPAETFPPVHFAFAAHMLRLGTDQCIGQTLVVALPMGATEAYTITKDPTDSGIRNEEQQQLGLIGE
jgi:hypothetical protein